MTIGLIVHVLAAVIWVGGMFFAYLVLRPATGALDPHARLELWGRVFRRFFPWVWAAVLLIALSGLTMMGQMGRVPAYALAMAGIGIVMFVIFLHIYFAPFGRLKRTVAAQDWKTAGAALSQIRVLVGINLALGLVNVAVAILGRLA